jgi:Insect cuticle protein
MTPVHYSYVDPLGSLITVRYTAGPDGYVETRNVQEDFVSIRQAAAPVRPVVAQQPAVVVAQPSDSDLVKFLAALPEST